MKLLMHHQAVFVAVLALNAYPDAPEDIPGNSGAFGPSLADEPSLIDVILHPSDGIDLEITYDLEAVGRVSVAVYVENDETGALSIILDNTIVADMAFGNGYPTEVEFGQVLYPAGTLMLADSIVRISQSELVRDVLLGAGRERWVCWLAGKMAGAVAGILTAGTCTAVAGPLAPGCFAPGSLGFKSMDDYVAGKCHKAQNHSRGREDHV